MSAGHVLMRTKIVSRIDFPGLQCASVLTVYCPTSARADHSATNPIGRRGIVLEGQQDTVPLEAE